MIALRFSGLFGLASRRTNLHSFRLLSTQSRQQGERQDHPGSITSLDRRSPSDSITATWSLKLDFGDDDKDSKISVTSVINELIREWLGPRKKKERVRMNWFVRARSGREVDADGLIFKPGERLSAPGYLIRGVVYDLSSLSLGGANLEQLVEGGRVSQELLPPPPDVEPETLGLGELLADQAGGSRLGSTTRLKEGREGGRIASQTTPLNVESQALGVLAAQVRGEGKALGSNPLKRETEADLVRLLEKRRESGGQAGTSGGGGFDREGAPASSKVLDLAAALDNIKGGSQTGNFPPPPKSSETFNSRTSFPVSDSSGRSRQDVNDLINPSAKPGVSKPSNPEEEQGGSSTWLTTALRESAEAEAPKKAEVELDTKIRNKYEGKLRSIREKAAARKREGESQETGAFDISQATKVGWKGGAIGVPGRSRGARWHVLPGAGELLRHLKERGLKQGLFAPAADSKREETLEQLQNFNFSPLQEVRDASEGSISPEKFRRLCDQWGLPPKQVLVVAGPGPIGRALLDAVAGSGCYLCQMSPYGAAPATPSSPKLTSTTVTEGLVDERGTTPLERFKQWLGIDDEELAGRGVISRNKNEPHFVVEDVPGLKAIVENLNGVSYRRSTMMRGLGSGRDRAAASADTERVFV